MFCVLFVCGHYLLSLWVYLSLHFLLILFYYFIFFWGGTSFLSFSVLCVFCVMSLEFDVIFIELQHNDYSIYVLLGNS